VTAFWTGDLGLPRGPSSSITNIRSTVESFGLRLGLKGAFRVALDLRLALSWLGDKDIISSRLPTRARNEEDNRLSSSLRFALKVRSRSRRCLSSWMSSAKLGCRSCRRSSALPLFAKGRQFSWFARTTSLSSKRRSSSRSLRR
jgi:hypothetical protein